MGALLGLGVMMDGGAYCRGLRTVCGGGRAVRFGRLSMLVHHFWGV